MPADCATVEATHVVAAPADHVIADQVLAEALGDNPTASASPELDAAIDALEAWEPEVARLNALHSAASMAWVGRPEDEEALREAERSAHDAWSEARRVREVLVDELLRIPGATPAEAIRKQVIAARFSEAKGTNYRTTDPDMAQTALDAALADLRALAGETPELDATAPPPNAASAEITRRIEAYRDALPDVEVANAAQDAAESAAHAIHHAAPRAWPPFAPILTVGAHTFTYRREVEGADRLAPELKALMVDALGARDRVIAAEDEASGQAAADRAVKEASRRQSEAWNRAQELAMDVVDAPAGTRADVLRQLAFAEEAFKFCYVDDGSQIETYRRLASQAAVLGPPETAAWNAAMSKVEALRRAEVKFDDEASAAQERLEARAGEMPDKGCLWENGTKKRALRRLDLEAGSDFSRHLTHLPPQTAAMIRETVTSYWDAYDRIEAEEGTERLIDEADAATVVTCNARRQIYPLRAPSLPAVLEKVAAYCANDLPETVIRFDDPEEVARALSEGGATAFIVHIYRDLVALCGAADPTSGVEAFDAKAWVAGFEAHPGHEIMFNGQPAYMDEAFPLPTDEELTITEPEMVEALEQHYRDSHPAHAAERVAEGKANRPVNIKNHGKVLDWAFTDHPVEHAHYSAVWQRYLAARKAEPAGRKDWLALSYWQRKLVKDFAKERDASRGKGGAA